MKRDPFVGHVRREELTTQADLLATQADLRAALADLKADLIRWQVGTLVAMTAVFAGLIKLLR